MCLPADDAFKPREDFDLLEDDADREIEIFKQFCLTTTVPAERPKLRVNIDLSKFTQ